MDLWGVTITGGEMLLLILAVGLSLAFEFVNGFHDTANAVATVIYTNTLKPNYAVVWSGMWNLIGALVSNGAVAYTILALLPPQLVLNSGSGAGFAMVFAILISAIIWNVGTWYLGLPASSSHTMIGAIMGVGIGFAISNGHPWTDGLNMGKVTSVGLALLVSPLVGFGFSALLLLAMKALVPIKELFDAPHGKVPPPMWIRALLMGTCTGVSYSHGSNDAQKGMGLLMLILIGIVPGAFAIDMTLSAEKIQALSSQSQTLVSYFQTKATGTTVAGEDAIKELETFKQGTAPTPAIYAAFSVECQSLSTKLSKLHSFSEITPADRFNIRNEMYALNDALNNLLGAKVPDPTIPPEAQKLATGLTNTTQYIPWWVKLMVALALGLGTMVGWKRIVVTVGEKIGKAHLTYAQGAAAEFIAMCTVLAADYGKAPVSTTHVLSSGIAGTMAANGSGLQTQTLINILLAWVLTLPVCIFLGALIFSSVLYAILHVFGA